jgi:hypothetical protein
MASRAPRAQVTTSSQNGPEPETTSIYSIVLRNPLPTVEALLKRDEADFLFLAGNVLLVGLEIIEWPVAVLALAVHAMARSRIKALRVVAEVAEEAD